MTGPSNGERLRLLRSRIETWGRWRRAHPQTTVLSTDTGYLRHYGTQPYGDYATSRALLYPLQWDRRYHPKELTVGLRLAGGAARAYPASEVEGAGGRVSESFAGHSVAVAFDPVTRVFSVDVPAAIEVVQGYWFAWMVFHPDSSVFSAPGER